MNLVCHDTNLSTMDDLRMGNRPSSWVQTADVGWVVFKSEILNFYTKNTYTDCSLCSHYTAFTEAAAK